MIFFLDKRNEGKGGGGGNSIKRGREIDRREIQIIKEKNGIYKKEQEQNQFIEKRIKIDNNRRGIKKEKKIDNSIHDGMNNRKKKMKGEWINQT